MKKANSAAELKGAEKAEVRKANVKDLDDILRLYLHLHETRIPEKDTQLLETWEQILCDPNHHIIVCTVREKIVSSCICVIIPNLTRGVRPYAFIENVVTDSAYRGKGYATECLNYARRIAIGQNCYKMMLLTGSKSNATLEFYRRAGYNSTDKPAFIQWL